jgi:phospho-N-acetylmuramoyl-pentapeptide-transferase
VILATSNAANFTDGLDGLAGNTTAVSFGCYAVIAFLQGQTWLSAFCFIMVGCLLGFLWFNANPAMIFMGDTGSQAIGAALGIVALMSGQWLLLPIIALIYFIETISVISQRLAFRYGMWKYGERVRIFKMAPIHHHFELSGWSEIQIVMRFFLLSLLSGLIGIALALISIKPI